MLSIDTMPELMDMKSKEKFTYPGIFDMSKKIVPAIVVEPVEQEEEEVVPVVKKTIPKKKVESGERKTLKLGKIKG